MAFQPPNTGQERQNRKILEQLEEQKKRLRMQNPVPVPTQNLSGSMPPGPQMSGIPVTPPAAGAGVPAMIIPDTQVMTPQQRTALQHATANSVGYFITQDSSFNNHILPVLPRFADGSRT